eukprot:CAMPEP_0194199464 /NCGR_PEP_ID=MMETSP0156-20130528/468_1 /TAXON_ID=33649 /ORGANISM="Thalassionema nitzschioides, Strain L26-B" /LENGTH=602 /DNA_ID=CAMNT_0038924357 /DNA_START=221 /DNA_END=2029 /DNA_ORIENTATION=-
MNPTNQWYEGSTRYAPYTNEQSDGKFLRGRVWGGHRDPMTVTQNPKEQLNDYDSSWNNGFNNNKVIVSTINENWQAPKWAEDEPPLRTPQMNSNIPQIVPPRQQQQQQQQTAWNTPPPTQNLQPPSQRQQQQEYSLPSHHTIDPLSQQQQPSPQYKQQQPKQIYSTPNDINNDHNRRHYSQQPLAPQPLQTKDEEQYYPIRDTPRLEKDEIYSPWKNNNNYNNNNANANNDAMQDYDRQQHTFHEFPAITSWNNYDNGERGRQEQTTWKEFRHQHDGGKNMVLSLPLDANLREAYREFPRTYQYYGDTPPPNWLETYYDMFLRRGKDDSHVINDLLNQLQYDDPIEITAGTNRYDKNGGDDVLLEQVASFVQGAIAYDVKTARNLNHKMNRYPYETLFDRCGVCTDKSLLFVRLAMTLGYDVGLFIFEKANHMAVGVRVPQDYGDFGTDYAFLETTNYAPIGQIPEAYMNNIKLCTNATLITLPSVRGNTGVYTKIIENKELEQFQEMRYGRDYLFLCSEQRQLKEQMADLHDQIDFWASQMEQYDHMSDNTSGGEGPMLPLEEYEVHQEIHFEHNTRVEAYNELVARFNRINQQQQSAAPS